MKNISKLTLGLLVAGFSLAGINSADASMSDRREHAQGKTAQHFPAPVRGEMSNLGLLGGKGATGAKPKPPAKTYTMEEVSDSEEVDVTKTPMYVALKTAFDQRAANVTKALTKIKADKVALDALTQEKTDLETQLQAATQELTELKAVLNAAIPYAVKLVKGEKPSDEENNAFADIDFKPLLDAVSAKIKAAKPKKKDYAPVNPTSLLGAEDKELGDLLS